MTMTRRNLPLLLCALTMLAALSSCSAPRDISINQHINADFSAMNDNDYRSSLKEIAHACKLKYHASDKQGDRPLKVLALGDGSLVLSDIGGQLVFSHISASGKQLWSLSSGLSKTQVDVASSAIIAHGELATPFLTLPVDLGPIRNLVYACDQTAIQLVRVADANGTYCARLLSKQLPDFSYSQVKFEGSTGVNSFAALIRLSQDSAHNERAQAAVRSQLEAFSSGTDAWLAEAAASVLIMNNAP